MSDFLLLYFHNILNQQISTIQWTKTVTLCTMKKVNITTEILSQADYLCYQIRKCSFKKVKYMSFDFFSSEPNIIYERWNHTPLFTTKIQTGTYPQNLIEATYVGPVSRDCIQNIFITRLFIRISNLFYLNFFWEKENYS